MPLHKPNGPAPSVEKRRASAALGWPGLPDRQAEDRCHRLGQTRPVTVYKLVAAETVDAKIAEIAMRKAEFADDALCESYATQAFAARLP